MIISLTQTQQHGLTTVTAVSDLVAPVFFYWYIDGAFISQNSTGEKSFHVERGEQLRVDVVDSNDADLDPIALSPGGYPARRTLEFVKSVDTEATAYLVRMHEA